LHRQRCESNAKEGTMQVREIMTASVVSCREDETLADAARLMAELDIGCVPVTAGAGSRRLVGIVTDRDVCLAGYHTGKPLSEIRVRDAMTEPVRTCSPDASVSEAEYVMRDAQVRRLPVVDERGLMVGILSLTDLAREAQHERRLNVPPLSRLEIGATLGAICTPRTSK
jgi:CBS domain-containing protein